MSISVTSRLRIRQRAGFLCEYCHSSEEASTSLFTLDHLIPQSLGGTDNEDNLALACHRCNGRRYNFIDGIDPETQMSIGCRLK
jgi:5-methylcytosine-specific restriction endonuclease McrA